MDLGEIIGKIKQKKELSSLPDSFILDNLNAVLKKFNISQLENLKKSGIKTIVKLVRSSLRKSAGMFQKSHEKIWKSRGSLLQQNDIQKLLETHVSTKERLPFYPRLKEIISSLKPESILDLGCGINPIALASQKIPYHAVDIQKHDLEIIKKYFEKNKIQGKAITLDISKSLSSLPEADLCLALKLLDILPDKARQAEKLLSLNCKKFIFSFSLKTLSGKPMLHKKRPWLERILNNKNLKFRTILSENEIFYIIEK